MQRIKPSAISFAFVAPSDETPPFLLRHQWHPLEAACVLTGAVDLTASLQSRRITVYLPLDLAKDSHAETLEPEEDSSSLARRICDLATQVSRDHLAAKRIPAEEVLAWALRRQLISHHHEAARAVLGVDNARAIYHRFNAQPAFDSAEPTIREPEGRPVSPSSTTKIPRKTTRQGKQFAKKREYILRAFVHECASRRGSYDQTFKTRQGVPHVVCTRLATEIDDRRAKYPTRLENEDGTLKGCELETIKKVARWVFRDATIDRNTHPSERENALKVAVRFLVASWESNEPSVSYNDRKTLLDATTFATAALDSFNRLAIPTDQLPTMDVFVATLNDLNEVGRLG